MTARFLSAPDVAAELGVSLRTAYEVMRAAGVQPILRCVRVSRANLDAWKKAQRPGYVSDERLVEAAGWEPSEQHVYFLGVGEVIKIGISDDPGRRRVAMQVAHVLEVRLLGVIREGGEETEAYLHERFAHLHERGEWYTESPDLLDFIARLQPKEAA